MSGAGIERPRSLRVVSWNVHGCVGTDGRFDPARTADALARLGPDVALLQEVGDNVGLHPPVDQATLLAEALGMTSVLGTTLRRSPFGYGSVTLTRLPILGQEAWDLSVRGREPRVCLCVDVGGAEIPLRTVNLHLGLGRRERRTQLGILLDEAGPLLADPAAPAVIAGDFNDWPPGAVTRAFERLFLDAGRRIATMARVRPAPTFPSRRPLLRLDRVYLSPTVEVRRCEVMRDERLRLASDHLPLVVEIELPPRAPGVVAHLPDATRAS